MRITTIDEARALVGRTFERGGRRVTFTDHYEEWLEVTEGKMCYWEYWDDISQYFLPGATEVKSEVTQ